MVEPTMKLDPVTRFVRGLPDRDYLLPREAAAVLGITRDRLKKLGRQHPETLGPGYDTWMGNVHLFLYTEEDLDQVRAYFVAMKDIRPSGPYRGGRGRPATWTASEHASRHRRRALARYHLLASARFASQGKHERAEKALAKSATLKTELAAELEVRKAQIKPDLWDPRSLHRARP